MTLEEKINLLRLVGDDFSDIWEQVLETGNSFYLFFQLFFFAKKKEFAQLSKLCPP